MDVEWRPLSIRPDDYSVSSDGRIKGPKTVRKLRVGEDGYLSCVIIADGLYVLVKAHIAVCLAFHGPRPPGYQAAHANGNRTDNRAENLRWKTRSENEREKVKHGTDNRGQKHWHSKVTDAQAEEIRRLGKLRKLSQRSIGELYGLSQSNVSRIIHGRVRNFDDGRETVVEMV